MKKMMKADTLDMTPTLIVAPLPVLRRNFELSLFCSCRPDMKKMMKADTLDMTHTELEDEDREERKNAVGNLIDIETKQDGIEMGSIRVSTRYTIQRENQVRPVRS
jgi:hypothetical protein